MEVSNFKKVYFRPFVGGNGVEWRFVVNENLMDEKRTMKPKGETTWKWVVDEYLSSFWCLGVGLCDVS